MAGRWSSRCKPVACPGREVPPGRRERRRRGNGVPKQPGPHCQEKPLARHGVPVPQTDTGRRGENPQVRGRTLAKELGKLPP